MKLNKSNLSKKTNVLGCTELILQQFFKFSNFNAMSAYQRLLIDSNSRPFVFNVAGLFMLKVSKLIMKLF